MVVAVVVIALVMVAVEIQPNIQFLRLLLITTGTSTTAATPITNTACPISGAKKDTLRHNVTECDMILAMFLDF